MEADMSYATAAIGVWNVGVSVTRARDVFVVVPPSQKKKTV